MRQWGGAGRVLIVDRRGSGDQWRSNQAGTRKSAQIAEIRAASGWHRVMVRPEVPAESRYLRFFRNFFRK
jgi:hypothetical protein